MPKVYIVGNSFYHQFNTMYTGRGYQVVNTLEEADIVQFTGGADISPALYGEHDHPSAYPSLARDKEEREAYAKAQQLGKFCAGVCRGGQLLNVLSGGSMYQDVDGHGAYYGHNAVDVESGQVFPVSSLHHQMMVLGGKGKLLAKAEKMLSPIKRGMTSLSVKPEEVIDTDVELEVEAAYYPETRSFCYQPHPEFVGANHPCREWYFNKLEELLNEQV